MLVAAHQVREHDARLGDALQALIQGFEYDRLLAFIEQVDALRGGESGREIT
jgi:hypothetical protein